MSDNAAYQASEIQSVNTGALPNRSEFPAVLATSASLQMAEYWHQTSMATGFPQQQAASFHGDCCAGRSAPGMLNPHVRETTSEGRAVRERRGFTWIQDHRCRGNQNQNYKKGETQWTITKIPPPKRRPDSRKVELQLQRA
jgi:hypothetical protein